MSYKIICGDSVSVLQSNGITRQVSIAFLDPPFNQQKDYSFHNDNLPEEDYWAMMRCVCKSVFDLTEEGGSIYFMQREKNAENVLRVLRETDWTFQNLIIWKKKTSAVPVQGRYSKQYQIIAFASKGEKPKTFNRLRITPPLPANYKYEREGGIYVTDVWDDIRELTSGFFAGPEALRESNGERFHKQQAPIALLLRIILTSTNVGDLILDPFAGTGTTNIVALQTNRKSIGIEIDPKNVACIKERLENLREADDVKSLYKDYLFTDNLSEIWGSEIYKPEIRKVSQTATLFD